PFVLGRDAVGTVVEAGEGAEDLLGQHLATSSLGHDGRQGAWAQRSEEHTSEVQSRFDLVCRLLLEKKKYFSRLFVHGRYEKSIYLWELLSDMKLCEANMINCFTYI